MSKTNRENILNISERIIKVLVDNGLVHKTGKPNFTKAERECGIKGTVIQKAVKRNGGLYDDNLDKFLGKFHVNREWLVTGNGEPYYTEPSKNDENKKNTDREEISILIKNLNRSGDTNEFLFNRVRDLEDFIKKNGLIPPI